MEKGELTFRSLYAQIDGKNYNVEDYPFDKVDDTNAPYVLKKATAYRYVTDVSKGLYPYRGVIEGDFNFRTAAVGIWVRKINHSHYKVIVVRPRNQREKDEYRIGKEFDVVAAMLNGDFSADQFMDNELSPADIGTSVYLPPIKADDDFLNKLMKLAIRAKGAPFEPYGKRMEAMAVDKRRSTESNNIKNNRRRSHREFRTMSADKFMQDADTWQLEPVLLLRNAPGAMHPMNIPDNALLAIFPSGNVFDINEMEIIDSTAMMNRAIAETTSQIARQEEEKTTEMEDDE